jgi:hypothetical protein
MIEYSDNELGKVIIKQNNRAKHVTARRKTDCTIMTVPLFLSHKQIIDALESLKPRLLAIKIDKKPTFTEDTVIESFTFTAGITRTNAFETCRMSLKEDKLTILVPEKMNIQEKKVQQNIKEMLINALRLEAKRVLPTKTDHFAKLFGLNYNQIKINKSLSRWGSCSGKKNINYSLYLMLLPEIYIDYIVCHELAHTVEMNHSEKFWRLLNDFCDGKAKDLRSSLRKYKSSEMLYLQ